MVKLGTVILTYYVLITTKLLSILGSLVNFPTDTVAVVGETVQLNCATDAKYPVNWQHVPVGSKSYEDIYISRVVVLPYYPRFNVSPSEAINSSTTEYHLVITSVSLEDAGQYTCMDQSGHGERRQAQLTVLESSPNCQSNIQSGVLVGENDCGETPDTIGVSCSLRYSGNIPPEMEWTNSNEVLNETQGTVEVRQTDKTTKISANLTLEASRTMDGTSITWRLKKHPERNWTSTEIKVTSMKSNISIQTLDQQQTITCPVDGNQNACTIEWKKNNMTLSNEPRLEVNSVGRYVCEATCLLRDHYCTVSLLTVEYISSTEEENNSGTFIIVAVVLAIFMISLSVLVICIVVVTRNRQRSKIMINKCRFFKIPSSEATSPLNNSTPNSCSSAAFPIETTQLSQDLC